MQLTDHCLAENPIWEGQESAAASSDSYSWGRVELPKEYGSIVSVSAGSTIRYLSCLAAHTLTKDYEAWQEIFKHLVCAGDSHSAALTAHGAVFAWGTFRGSSGPFGFAPTEKIALLPKLVWKPTKQAEQVVKICSGASYTSVRRVLNPKGQLYPLAPAYLLPRVWYDESVLQVRIMCLRFAMMAKCCPGALGSRASWGGSLPA